MKRKATKKMPGKKTQTAQRITAFRESLDMNQAKFAKALGVTHPLVSQCEGGKKPSTDMFVRFGRVAIESGRYNDAVWFWEKAGIDMQTLDAFMDQHAKDHTSTAAGITLVESLQSGSDRIPFPAQMLGENRASTKFVRVTHSQPPFGRGDILLLDTRAIALRELAEGDMLAIGDASTLLGLHIGTLSKKQVSEKVTHFILEQYQGKGMLFAWADGDTEPEVTFRVIGKVIAWVHATGEHSKHRRLDMDHSLSFHAALKEKKQ
ncbi:MAG: helix-turn-helix domain-containing protein [Terriglobales bacterium]